VSAANGRTVAIVLGLVAANIVAWLLAYAVFHDRPALLGTALLAWVFGLRHAVDADHIAAIDNVVRKLMQAGRRPITAGLFFSLGHSTVVLLACVAVGAAASHMHAALESTRLIGGIVGTVISATFLLVIATVNFVILAGVWRNVRQARRSGVYDEAALDLLLAGRGMLARIFRPLFNAISRSWHMYPLGFLFGLGFDTATEIGLLGIAATAAHGISAWQALLFPVLFATGMALVDGADSILMVGAYGWAFVNPARKLWYNLTITAASVLVALLIGGLEAIGLIADHLRPDGRIWRIIEALNRDLPDVGFAVLAIFASCWLASALLFHWRRPADQKR
jgi:high-affinity nickel-transport protein